MLSQGSYTVCGNIRESQKNDKRKRQDSGVGGVDKVGLLSKVSWKWKERETQPLCASRPRGGGGEQTGANEVRLCRNGGPGTNSCETTRVSSRHYWTVALRAHEDTQGCFFTGKTVRCSLRPPSVLNLRQEQWQTSSFVRSYQGSTSTPGGGQSQETEIGAPRSVQGPRDALISVDLGKPSFSQNCSSGVQWPCISKASRE